MTRDDVEKQIDGYIQLERHPGWQQLCEQLQRDSKALLAKMQAAKSNDELVRDTQTYLTLLGIPDMPRRMYQTLQNQLQTHAKKQ